jgi:hypothetical protein
VRRSPRLVREGCRHAHEDHVEVKDEIVFGALDAPCTRRNHKELSDERITYGRILDERGAKHGAAKMRRVFRLRCCLGGKWVSLGFQCAGDGTVQ